MFIGKFYVENVFLGIFLTKFESGIAKYRTFSVEFFFKKCIFIENWNFAQEFSILLGEQKIWLESYFVMTNMWSKFERIWKGSGKNFVRFTWNYSDTIISYLAFWFPRLIPPKKNHWPGEFRQHPGLKTTPRHQKLRSATANTRCRIYLVLLDSALSQNHT